MEMRRNGSRSMGSCSEISVKKNNWRALVGMLATTLRRGRGAVGPSHAGRTLFVSLHVGCLLPATKGPFDSMTPCLTRSALIKSSLESRRHTDTNLLQKTTRNPVNTHASAPVSLLSRGNKLASVWSAGSVIPHQWNPEKQTSHGAPCHGF